ncbi:MAG: thymidylate kinase [Marivirga sp.]|nr:thymidylate kinase [Marivirga sp.]
MENLVLIVIEGIDGSGKGTQAKALEQRLKQEGRRVTVFQFPQYEKTFFGSEVGRYLNGEFGTIETVPVKFSSLLYALDRFQARDEIINLLEQDVDVICDRYIGSNIAHQTARLPIKDRLEMTAWISHVESKVLSLPNPDLTIFLDMDVQQSQILVSKKDKRSYTDKVHDIHEESSHHLGDALLNFRELAIRFDWKTVKCTENNGQLRPPSVITDEILKEVIHARRSL